MSTVRNLLQNYHSSAEAAISTAVVIEFSATGTVVLVRLQLFNRGYLDGRRYRC